MTSTPINIAAIVEARMTSSRLPGKVLLPACGKPLLGHLVERLQRVPSISRIVIATTVNATDDALASFADEYGVSSFRGSEPDVMQRVLCAAEAVHADVIVGVTGDCPLIDPSLTEQTIRTFLNNRCDYATNGHVRTFPGGYGIQVYRTETLRRSASMSTDPLEHEHVTLHIRRNPEIFRHVYLVAPPELHWPEIDLSLDEQADYDLIKAIFEHFGAANPYFGCRETVNLLRTHPDLLALNRHVRRKGDT